MSYRTHTTKPLDAWLKDIYTAAERKRFAQLATGVGALAAPFMALANPTGGQVVGGQASISTPSGNSTVINQSSQNAAINWQAFSIGSNEYVQFIQPSSSSVVLNRVVGGNPSAILGTLTANGQVFLVNPNGIFFSKTATLDVQGLVASTLDMQPSDFMSGHYVFSKAAGAPDATVVNQGAITTAAGGYVVLAGDYVENDGVITAETGRVVLAANSGTTLTLGNNSLISYVVNSATLSKLAGVSNTGDITANGGAVVMTADVANALTATAVNNSGFIAAHSIQDHGGLIVLSAKGGGEIDNSGTLDASATDAGVAGGTVILRGDGFTNLASTSKIDAAGDGAMGGFIELSGHTLNVAGAVDPGAGGSLLIDPSVLTITTGSSVGGGTVGPFTVGVGYIHKKLNSNQNLTLIASTSIGHSAGVNNTSISAAGFGKLTIKTGHLIYSPSGSFGAGMACVSAGVCLPGTGRVLVKQAGTINLSGVNIDIGGGFSANAAGTNGRGGVIQTGNVTAQSIRLTGEQISVGNLTATVGSVSIFAYANVGPAIVNAGNIHANGGLAIYQSGSGGVSVGGISVAYNVRLEALGSGHSDYIKVNGNVTGSDVYMETQSKTNGDITITGSNGVYAKNRGISLNAENSSAADNGGNISVTGHLTTPYGGVVLQTFGGGTSGGNIHVGNISAGTNVSIGAVYNGAGSHFTVKTGNITAGNYNHGSSSGYIKVAMSGHDPHFSAGSLTAKGIFSSHGDCTDGCEGSTRGNISVRLNYPVTGSGSIKVNGPVKSSHDSVSFYVKGGDIYLTSVAGSNINITGNVFNAGVGGVTLRAANSNSSSSYRGNVVVNGKITATSGGVSVYAHANAYGGGNITVTGPVVAKTILMNASGSSGGGNIAAQTLHATGHFVGTAESPNAANIGFGVVLETNKLGSRFGYSGGKITITGGSNSASPFAIKADDGGVLLNARGGGCCSSAGAVRASHGDIIATGLVQVSASHQGSGYGGFITLKNVTGAAVHLNAYASSPTISVGAITANGTAGTISHAKADDVSVQTTRNGYGYGGSGRIYIYGPVKSSHGRVSLNAGYGSGAVYMGNHSPSGHYGISAASGVSVTGKYITLGDVTDAKGSIYISGAEITTGALTATSGGVSVYARASNGGSASINVNGPITAKSYVYVDLDLNSAGYAGAIHLKDVKTTGVPNSTNPYSGSVSIGAHACVGDCNHYVAANITTGAITTTGGPVYISQYGQYGSISVGAPSAGAPAVSGIHAGGSVAMFAYAGAYGGNITVTGPVVARAIAMYASGNTSGGNITAQTLEAKGAYNGSHESGDTGFGVVLKTNYNEPYNTGRYGGRIQINGGSNSASPFAIKADNGGVLINAVGGGGSGGGISATRGDIVATGLVQITASHQGSGYGGFITLKNVTGAAVHLQAYAANPSISVGAITANGTAGTTSHTKSDDVSVQTSRNGYGYGGGGGIYINGPVKSSHGRVILNAGYGGGVVSMASHSPSGRYGISAASGVNVTGKYVTLGNVTDAKGSIEISGSQINTGALTATSGSIRIFGSQNSLANPYIIVNGPITAKSGVDVRMSFYSPAYGGSIDLQDVTTTGTGVGSGQININATAYGNSSHQVRMRIDVGAIKTTAGDVYINQYGASGYVHVGSSSAGASGVRGANIGGALNINAYATGNGGSISLTGPVKANTIMLSADAGLSGGNIYAQTLEATGHFPTSGESGNGKYGIVLDARATGGSEAFGGNVKINGGSPSASIAVPAIKADVAGVRITALGGSDAGGQVKITNGDIVAHGLVDISASNVGSCCGGSIALRNVTGTAVHIQANGPRPDITVRAITANGTSHGKPDDVSVQINHGSGSRGTISINGPVKSSHGAVTLNAGLGSLSVGTNQITAAGNVSLTAGHMSFGNISAGGRVMLTASDSASHGASIAGGNITGKSVSINMYETNSPTRSGSINVGNVTATGAGTSDGVNIYAYMPGQHFSLVTGNLQAARQISVSAYDKSGGFSLGSVNAPNIQISLTGNGNISTGKLTAVNTAGTASVNIRAYNSDSHGTSNAIHVNGGISASGKLPASGPVNLTTGQPLVAKVMLQASGESAAAVHDVTVTGSVTITAHAAAYSHTSNHEAGLGRITTHTTGKGGAAEFDMIAGGKAGLASVSSGAITVTGADAAVNIVGHTISVGAVNVTASGHTVHRTISQTVPVGTFTSSNSAGVADVRLSGPSSAGGNAAVITTGAITVAGKGVAQVALNGASVSAGNITVTATAANGKRVVTGTDPINCGSTGSCGQLSGQFYRGINNSVSLNTGSLHAGRAAVFIGLNHHGSSPAASIHAGSISVHGVGQAGIDLSAAKITTKSLTASAAKGTMHGKGSGSSFISANDSTAHYKYTFALNGGGAGVDIDTRNGSNSGTVNVTGNVSATGPVAGVNIKGKLITVSGGVSAIASGGSLTSDIVATTGKGSYHVHFTGPGREIGGVEIHGGVGSGGSVSIGGTVTLKGPGLEGLVVTGHTVKVGGLNASASAMRSYSVLDTRTSSMANNFTAGSLLVAVDGVNVTGTGTHQTFSFTQAKVNGPATLHAAGNVYLPANLKVTGALGITAGGNITEDPSAVVLRVRGIDKAFSHGGNSNQFSPSIVKQFTAQASTANLTAGGSIDLTGDSVTASKKLTLKASTDILLGKAFLTGSAVSISAKTGVTNGGGSSARTITATTGKLSIKTTNGNVSMSSENLQAAGGSATLSAAAGDVNLYNAALNAGKLVTLTAGTDIYVGNASITGGTVDATAHNTITNSSGYGGAITAKTGNATLKATTGNVVLNNGTLIVSHGAALVSAANGNLSVSHGDISAAGKLMAHAGKQLNMSDASEHLGSLAATAGSSINLVDANVIATNAVTVTAGKTIFLANTRISGTAFNLSAAAGKISNGGSSGSLKATTGVNSIKAHTLINLNGETLHVGAGALTVSAATGSVNLVNASISAGGKFTAHAGKNLLMSGASATVGSFAGTAVAGSLGLKHATLDAGKLVTLTAGTDILLESASVTGSAVSATAHAGITDSGGYGGTITATTGALSLKATTGNIVMTNEKLNASGGAAALSAGGSLNLTSATVAAKGAETLKAGTTISLKRTLLSGSAVSATAATHIGNSSSAGTITATAGNVSFKTTGGNIILTGEKLKASGGAALLSAGGAGTLNVAQATVTAAKSLTLKAGSRILINNAGLSGSAVSATAQTGVTNGGSSSAGTITATVGKLTVKSTTGDVILAREDLQVGVGSAALSATAGSLDLKHATLDASKQVFLTAGTSILLESAAVTGSAVSATAHTDITDSGAYGGSITATKGNLTLKATTGNIVLNNERLNASGGAASLSAGGSLNLTSATVKAATSETLKAASNITIRDATLSASVFQASAVAGNVTNSSSGGSIKAKGVAITAGKNINLAGATVTVGKGAAPGVTGDAAVIAQFGVTNPNLALIATNTLNGPNIAGSASYVLLEGNTLGTQGTATLAAGAVVQFRPVGLTRTVGIDPTGGTAQTEYLVSELASFTGDKVVIGATGLSGGITVGSTGAVNLTGIDLTLLDTGTITGTGLLTAKSVTVLGATGAVSLLTNAGTVTVVSGTNVSIDNSADASAATITFGGATTGNVTAKFGGAGTLTLATSTLGNIDASFGGAGAVSFGSAVSTVNATSLTLVEGAPLNLGTLAFTLTGAANLTGNGVSGTGLITASAVTANALTGNVNLVTNTGALTVTAATNVTVTDSHAANTALNFGAGSFGNVNITAADGATLQSTLKAGQVFLNVGGGALNLGNNAVTVTGTATLQGTGVAGTGLLTAGTVVANGGTGNISLLTKSGSLLVTGGNNVTLDNTAFTAITAVSFLSGPYGAVTLDFGGNAVLSGFTLTASAIDLTATNGSLDLTSPTLSATGAVTLTAGQNLTLSGAHVTAGAFDATAHGNISDAGVAGTITATSADLTASTGKIVLTGETLHVTAGPATLSAGGGSIDLTSASLTASKQVTLTAKTHLLLGKTHITGSAVSATAKTGSISNGGSAGAITATVGNATFSAAHGNVVLGGDSLTVGGTARLTAAGSLDLTGATLHAGVASMAAGGSLNLTGVTANVTNAMALAAHNIVLSGVTINAGTFAAAASGTIHNGGGPGVITAADMLLTATHNINLSSTQLNIGNGTIPSVGGDVGMFQNLTDLGIPFTGTAPNGTFIAGGNLTLKGVALTGTYLYLQGANVSILGPASAPAHAVIQVIPIDTTVSIGIEDQPANTETFNLSNQGFIGLFPGTTVVVGTLGDATLKPPAAAESGIVTVGTNGPIVLANNTNLVILTTGTVTGLGNVSGTGIIASLSTVIGPPIPPVTAGEVDPNSTSTTSGSIPDDQKKKQNGDTGNTDTGSGGSTPPVSQDTSTAGVCH